MRSDVPTICIIGAGFSGMCAAIQIEKKLKNKVTYTIFDENDTFGGTWLVNNYPGCACDVESHMYSFSFEPNPNWSFSYSSKEEIFQYMQNVAQKYNLENRTRFRVTVKKTVWDEADAKWKVTIFDHRTKQTQELEFNYLISGQGVLRVPSVPEQFKSYTGPVMHTAEWDDAIKIDNKRVAVIGSGASAIQVIPAIAPKVRELHSYQRKPAWVLPRNQYKFHAWIQKLFQIFPIIMWLFRSFLFFRREAILPVFYTNSNFGKKAEKLSNSYLKSKVQDKELQKKLLPTYRIGCKRITITNDYLPTFNQPHVHLHREPIVSVSGNKILTADGNSQEIDVLILATGFKVQEFFAPLEIIGRNNLDILHYWKKKGPQAYFGIVSNDIPNAFILLGPNTALGHNSVVFMIECQVNFLINILKHCLKTRSKMFTVRKSVEREYLISMFEDMKKTVWATDCGAWYANEQGQVTSIYPGSCVNYYFKTRSFNPNDFEFYSQ